MRLRTVLSLATAGLLAAPSIAAADYPHVVAPGETLTSVAAADGLTVAAIAAANGLSPFAQIVAGTTLMIPPQSGLAPTGVPAAAPAATSSTAATSTPGDGDADGDDPSGAVEVSTAPAPAGGSYVVQPGDTLSAIAGRAGMTIEALAAANGLDPNGVLLSGAVLKLSGSGAPAATVSPAQAAASQPIGAASLGSPNGPPYPTPERVSPSQVASIASSDGVSPSLADAIGFQESGFNNDLVSNTGAVGVMQIEPGTWNWVQRTLSATPLNPASAVDNVRGGVLMLRSLLDASGGDPAMAAAGYYQGLASVQRNGMYSDTQQYVNDVMALRTRFGGP
jgi:LysM repeat protein